MSPEAELQELLRAGVTVEQVMTSALTASSDGELLAELRRRRSLRGQLGVVLAFVGDPMRAPLAHPIGSDERRQATQALVRDLRLWSPDGHLLVALAADLAEQLWLPEEEG